MKTWKWLLLYFGTFLLFSSVWYRDDQNLHRLADRQAFAIEQQNKLVTAVMKGYAARHGEDIGYGSVSFPPNWGDLEKLPEFTALDYDAKVNAAGEWLRQNFESYHQLCSNLSDQALKERQLLQDGIERGKGMIQYCNDLKKSNDTLAAQNKQSEAKLDDFQRRAEVDKVMIQTLESENATETNELKQGASAMKDVANQIQRAEDASPSENVPLTGSYLSSRPYPPSPYHNQTVITPDGIYQRTVIDND